MDERAVLKAIDSLGYCLLPRTHRDSPGGSGLLVGICREPALRHFDPVAVHLRLPDRQGMVKWWKLSLLSAAPASDRICPGRLILSDRLDRRVDFFTFGGSLQVAPSHEACIYELRSPAPILALVAGEETVADQLAAEADSLLGRLEARWGHDGYGFSRRLVEIEPLQFYVGTLYSLLEQYRRCHALEETYYELCTVLQREKRWLISQALWPENPRMLEDLLAPA